MENNLVKALGIEKLAPEERQEILAKVEARLEEVVMRTVVENLSEEEAKKMREIMAKGANIAEEVSVITAGVPLLAEKIERAVGEEIEKLRQVLAG